MGGYSSNPTVARGYSRPPTITAPAAWPRTAPLLSSQHKNDRGYEWWTTDGKLVLEDPEYCAYVAFTVGSWIEMLSKVLRRLIWSTIVTVDRRP